MLTPEPLVLREVGPFVNEDSPDSIHYRTCDFCWDSACEDIWAGELDEAKWRVFYLLPDGTCVCGNCVPGLE